MLIKEISKQTGFSKDTIRYYEKIGLLELDKNKRGANNYRRFGQKEIERLMQIKFLKQFGFTLREIKNLFTLLESKLINCASAAELADQKIRAIEDEIKKLKLMKSKLISAKNICPGNCREVIKKQNFKM